MGELLSECSLVHDSLRSISAGAGGPPAHSGRACWLNTCLDLLEVNMELGAYCLLVMMIGFAFAMPSFECLRGSEVHVSGRNHSTSLAYLGSAFHRSRSQLMCIGKPWVYRQSAAPIFKQRA
eukprot:3003274-Amphidinium_carterae.1